MDARSRNEADERAERRVKDLRDLHSHTAVYIAVNAIFAVIDLVDGPGATELLGPDWAYYPVVIWGIVLAVHALVTLGFEGRRFVGSDWERRKLAQYTQEERRRDPLHRISQENAPAK